MVTETVEDDFIVHSNDRSNKLGDSNSFSANQETALCPYHCPLKKLTIPSAGRGDGSVFSLRQAAEELWLDDHCILAERAPPGTHDLTIDHNDITQGVT
jgi:hypothetical protein